jgi:hypothetical protein
MEAKLTELVNRLKSAAGDNLKAVVLYGSAVTSEFIAARSDLNILCLVGRAGAHDLERLHDVSEWWMRQGNPAPLLFTFDELMRSADVFAIELLDMKSRHRMLFGSDFLEQLEIPLSLHGLQVERELRSGWVRLRQAILAAPRKRKVHFGILLASLPAFCTLFRHALVALGQPAPHTKREAIAGVASLAGANPSAFDAMLDYREGKKKEKEIDVESAVNNYLEFVEVVTNEVDRRLDSAGN